MARVMSFITFRIAPRMPAKSAPSRVGDEATSYSLYRRLKRPSKRPRRKPWSVPSPRSLAIKLPSGFREVVFGAKVFDSVNMNERSAPKGSFQRQSRNGWTTMPFSVVVPTASVAGSILSKP